MQNRKEPIPRCNQKLDKTRASCCGSGDGNFFLTWGTTETLRGCSGPSRIRATEAVMLKAPDSSAEQRPLSGALRGLLGPAPRAGRGLPAGRAPLERTRAARRSTGARVRGGGMGVGVGARASVGPGARAAGRGSPEPPAKGPPRWRVLGARRFAPGSPSGRRVAGAGRGRRGGSLPRAPAASRARAGSPPLPSPPPAAAPRPVLGGGAWQDEPGPRARGLAAAAHTHPPFSRTHPPPLPPSSRLSAPNASQPAGEPARRPRLAGSARAHLTGRPGTLKAGPPPSPPWLELPPPPLPPWAGPPGARAPPPPAPPPRDVDSEPRARALQLGASAATSASPGRGHLASLPRPFTALAGAVRGRDGHGGTCFCHCPVTAPAQRCYCCGGGGCC